MYFGLVHRLLYQLFLQNINCVKFNDESTLILSGNEVDIVILKIRL